MDRRVLIASGLATLGVANSTFAQPQGGGPTPGQPAYKTQSDAPPLSPDDRPGSERDRRAETYSSDELVSALSDFFGVTAESAGAAVERIFKENGRPTAYIAGEEASGALTVGLRYGRGLLYMKNQPHLEVFWQGPSIGWDVGGNASRTFTLCYNLQSPREVYQRFPGVEGSAYFIGGLGINYQRADDITLAPIRAGVGLRLGANVGYLAYTKTRHILPF